MRIAWLSRNLLTVKDGDQPAKQLESQFAEKARRKSAETSQRNAWKTQNTGALFMGMGARDASQLTVEVPAHLTGLTCTPSGEVVYSLELRDVSGVFEVSRDGSDEKRLYHGAMGGLRDLARPSTIVQLDAKSGALSTLAEAPGFDLCQPRVGADGALYFVRRPWAGEASTSFVDVLLGVLLLPWRLLTAIAGFFNFFSLRYSGKPLLGGRDARSREADIRRMMLWGNLAAAQQEALDQVTEEQLKAVRAPSDWVLVKRSSAGVEEVLLKGVAAWDLLADGTVVFTDGVDISALAPEGAVTKLASDVGVRAVVALPA